MGGESQKTLYAFSYTPSLHNRRFMSQAKRSEGGILCEARDEGRRKQSACFYSIVHVVDMGRARTMDCSQRVIFSSYPRLAIRAGPACRSKCRVRLAWLIKRLSCRLLRTSRYDRALFRPYVVCLRLGSLSFSLLLIPDQIAAENEAYMQPWVVHCEMFFVCGLRLEKKKLQSGIKWGFVKVSRQIQTGI